MFFKELKQSIHVIWEAAIDFYNKVIAPGVTGNMLMAFITILIGLLLLALAAFVTYYTTPPGFAGMV